MKKIKVVGVLGRSGTGKNTVVDNLRVMGGERFNVPLLTTSRPKRPGEIEGREYHFVTKEKALAAIESGEAIWASCFNDWYYYLPVGHLHPDKVNLLVLNPSAACTMDKFQKDNISMRLFELVLEDQDLWLRLSKRPDLDEVARRWPEDKKDFNEPYYKSLPVCHIVNNNSNITAYMIFNYLCGMEDSWAEEVKPFIYTPNIYQGSP